MEFYSHATEINGIRKGSKLLKNHLLDVSHKAKKSILPMVNLSISEKPEKIVSDLTVFHDLGKYTTFFQNYLLGKEKVNQKLKNHSLIGAIYLLNKFNDDPFYAAILYYIIINHHTSLSNILGTGLFNANIETDSFINRQLDDIHKNKSLINNEINDLDIERFLIFPQDKVQKNIRKTIKKIIIKSPSVQHYFTINYLFSLLIEADKLDASGTSLYTRKKLPVNAVENFIGKADSKKLPPLEKIDGYEQNTIRNWVRASVLENLEDKNILKENIFTLTAPTGIGKTLTALDFALRLKKQISQKENFEPQIIYGLPFINIIEQGLKVYNDVFDKTGVNILGHYQYADIFGTDNNTESYDKKLMKLNTWQSDIVITSFVQFFETLISNRNKMLLKFNHLAGAIVILDEIQTLRLEQLPLIGAVLFYLSKYLNTRLILMTATKPKIFELANKEIVENEEGQKITPRELLKDYEKVFEKFNRTKIIPLLENDLETAADFYGLFTKKRKNNESCLIVCNTVQRSIDIFNELKENGIKNLYYLSTNIVPAVRLNIIENIKTDIKKGKAPVLVSTQVVEAGVDLDFDMGFRDLAPIDSIVQVAGRINRENNPDKILSPLYVIQFRKDNANYDAALVYDSLTRQQVIKALQNKKEIPENQYLRMLEEYYAGISEKEAFTEARSLFNAMKTLKYDSDDNNELTVNKFKIIKSATWTKSVFIELNDKAEKARRAYTAMLNGEITKADFDRNFKKTFNQYIIAVPEKYSGELENINEYTDSIKLVRNEKINNYYSVETGFIRETPTYDIL